jgi:hypothetical protein
MGFETNGTSAFEAKLRHILFRFDCPSSHALGEYRLGLFNARECVVIEGHLARCHHCRAELAMLNQFLSDTGADPVPASRATPEASKPRRTVVARPVAWRPGFALGMSFLGGVSAYPGGRGVSSGPARRYVAEGITIQLTVEPDPARSDRRLVLGLVLPPEDDLPTWEGTPVVLQQTGQIVGVVYVDDLSTFVFSGVAPGEYDILLQGETHIRLKTVTVT